MSGRDIELWKLAFDGLKSAALIGGAIWAAWRFRRERTHSSQVEFTVDVVLHGPVNGRYAAEFILTFNNKGKTRVQIERIELRVRGIMSNEMLVDWPGHGNRLLFKHMLVKADDILPKNYGYMFAEPGIKQEYRYNSHIPEECVMLLARAQFFYDKDHPHSAERFVSVKQTQRA